MTSPSRESPEHLPPPLQAAEDDIAIRVLGLSDLHMNIRGYDYFADRAQASGGLARAATLIDNLRAEAPNSLLFDNGDVLQGNPMGDYAAARHATGEPVAHPMIVALNTLGIDAATLGNHEFNFGLDLLSHALSHARFPVVSANTIRRLGQRPEEDRTLLPPFVVLDRTFRDGAANPHDLRIGVIGFLPPQITSWDRKHLSGRIFTRDIVETARAYVPIMKADGADLIVALSHSGIEDVEERPGLEHASIPLAAIPGIDVIIAGHSHLVFPSPAFPRSEVVDAENGRLHGIPATMPGFAGSHVGVVDLHLSRSGTGWRVHSSRVTTPPVPESAREPGRTERAILAATEAAHEGTLHHVRRPVGEIAEPLHTYFAMLEPCAATRLVATAQAHRVRELLRDTEYSALPLLSAATAFKTGGRGGANNFTHIPAGSIAVRNLADLYGYPNALRALLVKGAGLRSWLEYAAGIFRRIEPGGGDQPLISISFPSYNFDTITGVTYRIDLTRPARFDKTGTLANPGSRRIRDLCYKGEPVSDDQPFVVATNDYRASRSGTFPGADDGTPIPIAPETHHDVLIRYVKSTGADRVLADPPWSFEPVPGASALFDTSPGALAYPDRLRALGLTPLGPLDNGFLRLRMLLDRAIRRPESPAMPDRANARPVPPAKGAG